MIGNIKIKKNKCFIKVIMFPYLKKEIQLNYKRTRETQNRLESNQNYQQRGKTWMTN